ncbi:hypothetical protein [Dinghuibacter silviterrae]|uniref:Uncharacterized protein n=1 Tax=Dinghuibacter silviterrae TaxID=1539049 RepID=A0A4V3GM04_9BACT|nr:hypothetical protein [Dinghuibacter silviterrae]TDX01483.1 hypothetical protein EDB95_2519 [Dinghuibacter silviterrae]
MNQQQVITNTITVGTVGQIEYFQMLLPYDVERIIGFEVVVSMWSAPPAIKAFFIIRPPHAVDSRFIVMPNVHFGRLMLQIPGCPGIIYQGDVVEDGNIHMGENLANTHWQPAVWSHNTRRTEISLNVANPDFIEGIFRNDWTGSSAYVLTIHLWIEKKM